MLSLRPACYQPFRPANLSDELGGLPLILYNGPQCGVTSYSAEWPLVYSIYYNAGWGKGVLSAIKGESAEAFYSAMFGRLIKVVDCCFCLCGGLVGGFERVRSKILAQRRTQAYAHAHDGHGVAPS